MIDPKDIIAHCAEAYHVPIEQIMTYNRRKHVTEARALAQYMIRHYTSWSYGEIGDLFGNDHSSVIHNCKKIEKMLAESRCVHYTINTYIRGTNK